MHKKYLNEKKNPLDEDFFIPTPVSASVNISEEEEARNLEYVLKNLFDALKCPKFDVPEE